MASSPRHEPRKAINPILEAGYQLEIANDPAIIRATGAAPRKHRPSTAEQVSQGEGKASVQVIGRGQHVTPSSGKRRS